MWLSFYDRKNVKYSLGVIGHPTKIVTKCRSHVVKKYLLHVIYSI